MDVLKCFNIAQDGPARHATVVDWFRAGLGVASSSIALSYHGAEMSRGELDALSGKVAAFLVKNGVEPGDRVGLCLSRSFEMIACLMGILKAGAAYVPLDPAYPAERLRMMREDADLAAMLVHRAWADVFPGASPMVWEKVERDVKALEPLLEVDIDSEDVAYVIFTSGSTGRPKGIEMPHRALSNLIDWQLERDSFRPAARTLQYSSVSFDVSFQEIATTLVSGGTLYLISDADRRDPRELLAVLSENAIERIFLPYVAFRGLVEAAVLRQEPLPALREVITAGEQLWLDAATRAFFAELDGATLDNQYGPSETHVITARLLEGDPAAWPDLPDIGFPLKNCGTCVLDEQGNPVAEGEIGELFLAGRNVATGYINQPERTAEVFVPNPFEVPERTVLYKTGDLASYNAEGSIAFHGRADDQIKIRGHRVEPGEISHAVVSFAGVGQCVARAVVGEDHLARLVAYFTSDSPVDVGELRASLEAALPDYMVPAFLIRINAFPTTPSGKVDVHALPPPTIRDTRFAEHEVEYESDTQRDLAGIWEKLLGLPALPPAADFFELGGDSLRAVTLFLEVSRTFGSELSLATLTSAPTLRSLAEVIDGHAEGPDLSSYRSLEMLNPGEHGEPPLFLIHGGQGNVLVFADLVRALGASQPVYAFQWAGWDGGHGPADVMEMVHAYRDELIRFHEGGPIRLGGYCIGGLIALELAPLLRAAGMEVIDPLIICDSPNLASANYLSTEPWDDAASIARFKCVEDQLDELCVDRPEKDAVPRANYTAPSGKAALIRSIPGMMPALRVAKLWRDGRGDRALWKEAASALATGGKVPMGARAEYCRLSLVRAAKHHRAQRYAGDVLYFRSNSLIGRDFALKGWWTDPTLGFEELCGGGFTAYAVGGAHTNVMSQPELIRLVAESLAGGAPN